MKMIDAINFENQRKKRGQTYPLFVRYFRKLEEDEGVSAKEGSHGCWLAKRLPY